MDEESAKRLRAPAPPDEVGKLPRVTCKDCRESRSRVCDKHGKSKCQVCGNYLTNAHIHLDYFGHAETTDRLLDVDPEWSWEPVAWSPEGTPVVSKHGNNLVMWGRLTVCGVTRLGVGTCEATKDDAHKELIGDFLRNAAMRFGVALDLWRKSEKAQADEEHTEHAEAPQPPPKPAAAKKPAPAADPVEETKERIGSLANHQAVQNIYADLPGDQKLRTLGWWKAEGFPLMASGRPNPLKLSQEDAERALDFLEGLDKNAEEGSEAPTAAIATPSGVATPAANGGAPSSAQNTSGSDGGASPDAPAQPTVQVERTDPEVLPELPAELLAMEAPSSPAEVRRAFDAKKAETKKPGAR